MSTFPGLDTHRIGTLLRLRGKLTIRQFTREKGRIVGAVLALIIFGPMIAVFTILTYAGYSRLPDPWPTELLGGVLVLLWFIWVAAPILFTAANETADLTRLLVYPIRRRDLVVSILLGTFFDYPTYLVLPLLGAIFVGFGFTPVLPVLILAVLLSYAHVIIIGQLVTTALGGILQSRRFRDMLIIVASLLGASCYFFQALINRFVQNIPDVAFEQLPDFSPLDTLQWLPTGAAARAVEQALAGSWGMAGVWLGYSAVLLLLLTWVWWRLLVRLTTGEGFIWQLAPRQETVDVKRPSSPSYSLFTWLPADLAQLVDKELKSIWRIPQRRVGFIQGMVMPFLMVGAIFLNEGFAFNRASIWMGLISPFYALFLFWVNTQNMLGFEGRGLSALLLTPIPRQRIFLAKGIALGLSSSIPMFIIGAVVIYLSNNWIAWAALPTGMSMGIAVMAVTAVSSVLFPVPINLESKQMRGSISTGGGCLAGLANAFLVPLLIAAVASPNAILLVLGYGYEQPWLGLLNVVVAPLYSLVVFWLATRLAGNLLLEREAEVIAALRLPEYE